MGLKNFSKNDLTATNLQTLVDALKIAVSNREYKTIEDFAKAFATAIQSETIEVTAGKRFLDVNGEKVDVSDAVSQIMTEIDKTKSFSETDPTKIAEFSNMYAEVNSQLTALFMQDKMQQELVQRGFSPERFAEVQVEANAESDRKIRVYDNKVKAYTGIKKKVLEPRDIVDSNGNVKEISLATKIKDEKNAKVFLEGLYSDINTIIGLEAAITKMEAEIAADSTKENLHRDKINANKALIAQKTTDMTGKIKSIKDLHLDGFEGYFSKIEHCDDASKVTREAARANIYEVINGAVPIFDADGNVTATMSSTLKSMDSRIKSAYEKLYNNLKEPKKAGKDTFTPAELDEFKKITSTNPTEIADAEKAIDAAIAKIENEIKRNQTFKKQEEVLKIARERGAAEFKTRSDRFNTLNDKFEQVQATDANGSPLFVDENGNETVEATNPANGNPNAPRMVTRPKDATRRQYLQDAGIDENAERNALISSQRTNIQNLSRREKRQLLKANGIGNPFTRFFPGRLINANIDTLASSRASADIAALDQRVNNTVSTAANRDIAQLQDDQYIISTVRASYDGLIQSAVTQREIANGAYENNEVLNNRQNNTSAIKAMQDASMEEVSIRMAQALLTGINLDVYNEARKRYDHKQIAREHNIKNGNTVDYGQNPTHEDR